MLIASLSDKSFLSAQAKSMRMEGIFWISVYVTKL
jgi:hypothetical protein